MEPEYLRKFLALGLAGVGTPNTWFVGKVARVVLMFLLKNQGQPKRNQIEPKRNFSEKDGGIWMIVSSEYFANTSWGRFVACWFQ